MARGATSGFAKLLSPVFCFTDGKQADACLGANLDSVLPDSFFFYILFNFFFFFNYHFQMGQGLSSKQGSIAPISKWGVDFEIRSRSNPPKINAFAIDTP